MSAARVLAPTLFALAVLLGPPRANADDEAPVTTTLEVVTYDSRANNVTLKDEAGREIVYQVDDKTKIQSGKNKLALSDLKQGARVAISGAAKGSKTVATSIEVVEPSAK